MAIVIGICVIFALRKHHHPESNADPNNNDPVITNFKAIDVVQYGAAGDGKTDDSRVNIHTFRLLSYVFNALLFLIVFIIQRHF